MKVLSVSYKSPDAAARFTQSLRDTGFGVLTDHPIAPELVSNVFADWAAFFAASINLCRSVAIPAPPCCPQSQCDAPWRSWGGAVRYPAYAAFASTQV